ncbi:MAG: hypothetical protein E7350_02230 [Clostridiales bacterium]|nr:hypothetical protein [Clostridiales bacterium]
MKLRECIELAAIALNLGDVLGRELTDTDKQLIACANNCIDEIASEYLPIKKEKTVAAEGGLIAYSLLDEAVYDVLEVRDKKGNAVEFCVKPSHIQVEHDGEYTVCYCTRPPVLGVDDEVPIALKLSPRILSYGIVAEYLLCGGFYEEAVTFDARFKDALKRATSGFKEKRIKLRRWLL